MKQLLITIAAVVLVGCGPSASDISIHDAAAGGHINAIKQHLAAGANINAKDINQWTPLPHHAYANANQQDPSAFAQPVVQTASKARQTLCHTG